MTGWNQKATCFILLSALLFTTLLAGCGFARTTALLPESTPAAEGTSFGEMRIKKNGEAAVDWSHAGEGYILARRGVSGKKWKLRVTKDETYTYDLIGEGWTAVPVSEGDGKYVAAVYEQTEGTTYLPILMTDFNVELADPCSPFLRPNQQVNYTTAPKTLAKAVELTAACVSDGEKIEKIYSFVSGTLSYDEERAETVQSGYIPALDEVLEEEKGICLDFAALMTAMLRSQGVPCKLVVGDAGMAYHAWTEVWDATEGAWVRYDPTFTASGTDTSNVEYAAKFYY